jgi:hypothetical protein
MSAALPLILAKWASMPSALTINSGANAWRCENMGHRDRSDRANEAHDASSVAAHSFFGLSRSSGLEERCWFVPMVQIYSRLVNWSKIASLV